MDAVRAVRYALLAGQPFVSESKRALEALRDYVLRYRGR
jgi:hypothetical protein